MIKEKIEFGGKTLSIESGKLAKQASGSCIVQYGDTSLLVAVTASKGLDEDRGFFPLSVEYREKFYAAGRIPGGFFKREARPTEHEILASRLTDRPLRPLFEKGFNNETRVDIYVLSYDSENEADVLAALGASFSLMISDIPWNGPIATVRVGRIEGELKINPTKSEMECSDINIVVSGTSDSIMMVEGECDFITEEDFLNILEFSHKSINDLISFQINAAKALNIVKREIPDKVINEDLVAAIDKIVSDDDIKKLNMPKVKEDRYGDIDKYIEGAISKLEEDYPDDLGFIKSNIDDRISHDLRMAVIKENKRADGRDTKTVRNIEIETSILPRAHGSATFTRGETQALVVTTLGGKRDEQMLDNIDGLTYKNHMLHYNFPSFSVGEARGKFSLSRREVGHGNLAERSIKRSLPSFEDFPYTTRVVSEILESNGSSSMATVCGSILSMMDAGVPIKEPVAGVAMGLIKEGDDYAVLTDILGTEDHIGDMDFKVAGSKRGITAIQMDIKIDGLSIAIMKDALAQAKDARIHILDEMLKALPEYRQKLSDFAPKIAQSTIPVDNIGEFIGPGGKNIKALAEKYECEINIDDDGSCTILGQDQSLIDEVVAYVEKYSLELTPGESYEGEVVKIMDFGAFVKLTPNKDGLLHISEIKKERVQKVEDHLKVGDIIKVKLLKIDHGKLSLSMKALL
ncbi:MAG: polyribonucleotide nucleotidyltransferase [Candidatus Marinimicrobia bacterium]|nr:polyribonucleotide nucleotidyltransferase [Candidatus Neomarinimicrobiota bacterium]